MFSSNHGKICFRSNSFYGPQMMVSFRKAQFENYTCFTTRLATYVYNSPDLDNRKQARRSIDERI